MYQSFFFLLGLVWLAASQTNSGYSDGGLASNFPVGPTDLNVAGATLSTFYVSLIPGQTITLYLSNGLLNNDYSLYPITGFTYQYNVNGLPNWASYQSSTRSITANPPSSFVNSQQFTISYSDQRNNTANITGIFNQGNFSSVMQVNYITANLLYTRPNTYTLIFPLLTTRDSTLKSIRANNFGAMTNVGVYPWTNLIPLTRQTLVSISSGAVIPASTTVIIPNQNNGFVSPQGTVVVNNIPQTTYPQTNNFPQNTTFPQTVTQTTTIPSTPFVFSTPSDNGIASINSTSTTTTITAPQSTNTPIIVATPVNVTTPFNIPSNGIVNPVGFNASTPSTRTTTTTQTIITGSAAALANLSNFGINTTPAPAISTVPVSNGSTTQTFYSNTNQPSITPITFPSNTITPVVITPLPTNPVLIPTITPLTPNANTAATSISPGTITTTTFGTPIIVNNPS